MIFGRHQRLWLVLHCYRMMGKVLLGTLAAPRHNCLAMTGDCIHYLFHRVCHHMAWGSFSSNQHHGVTQGFPSWSDVHTVSANLSTIYTPNTI